jgi:hypothetical protein
MPTNQQIEVKRLNLDLRNFRTSPQGDEVSAIHAMQMIAPQKLWGLLESLLDGYLPTENVIVLKDAKGRHVVKEGNRRVACMKLIHKFIHDPSIDIPKKLADLIANKDPKWLKANSKIPCVVYEQTEEAMVDRVVALTHGKGESASRDPWKSVAAARHNRDMAGGKEPGLDLLEKYLDRGKNCTRDQATRWAGTFPVTVLDEALKKVAPLIAQKSAKAVADAYPAISVVKTLDQIVYDIGMERFGFKEMRTKEFFTTTYGLGSAIGTGSSAGGSGGASSGVATGGSGSGGVKGGSAGASGGGGGASSSAGSGGNSRGLRAVVMTDPRSVKRLLRTFAPKGVDRAKIATLAQELRDLNIADTPHAFCFVLRSIFEISAKQYAKANGISMVTQTNKGPKEKSMVSLLRDACTHLTKGKPKHDPYVRGLHGAMQELANPTGVLSVDSLSQLIHNAKFSIKVGDICVVFHHVFPLLEEITQ